MILIDSKGFIHEHSYFHYDEYRFSDNIDDLVDFSYKTNLSLINETTVALAITWRFWKDEIEIEETTTHLIDVTEKTFYSHLKNIKLDGVINDLIVHFGNANASANK